MRGLIAVDEVLASLPKERQKAIAARGAALLAKVERRMTLAELRKRRKISQAKMAEALGIGQMQISRLEQRKDLRLSTLQRTIAAMGGHLTMIATFPDQEPVILIPAQALEKKVAEARKTVAEARKTVGGAKSARISARAEGKSRARA
jgi:transcriptional regulator with XRE-family HTH domain